VRNFVLLIACAAAIYLSSEWFVNAIEWLGQRLKVGKMAVGTVLAAFGTALPESVVTLVAVLTGKTEEAKNVGVGAAMGGPLALATVAYGVTGAVLLVHRRKARAEALTLVTVPVGATPVVGWPSNRSQDQDPDRAVLDDAAGLHRLAKDQRWFLPIFVVKVLLGLVAFSFKPALGLLFFAVYAVYFWRELKGDDDSADAEDDEPLHPLKLQPNAASPATWAVATQTLAALMVIFLASQLFVKQLDAVGPMLGLSGAVTALLLAPIATELPEIMNAIVWVRQGKTKLALANISGAMMIQVTVPSGLGLLFTTWTFDGALLWSGLVTMAAISYLLASIRAGTLTPIQLSLAGAFYLVFAIGLIPILA
jgi:cation:H+ antiporter